MENIFNVIVEGPDGVGKSTLISNLFRHYHFRYMCYHRGEMSNYVFAKKYHRQFFSTQNKLPFIYIYLTCSKQQMHQRIIERASSEKWNDTDVINESSKLDDIDLFEQAFEAMKNDYIIYRIDTTNLSSDETCKKAIEILDNYQSLMIDDSNLTSWNKMYQKICAKLNIPFKVFKNQPYINNKPVMVESTLHNGEYETYSDKKCYDNTLYAMAYDTSVYSAVNSVKKEYDFNYIINSKIKRRPEVFEYYNEIEKNHLTCLVSERNNLVKKSSSLIGVNDSFAEDYILNIAKSYATIYCSRDLAYLELQTARLYEAIIAQNIVFVDKYTDPENKILSQIYPNDDELQQLLTVEPSTLIDHYEQVMSNETLRQYIIEKQLAFWKKNVEACKQFYKENVK